MVIMIIVENGNLSLILPSVDDILFVCLKMLNISNFASCLKILWKFFEYVFSTTGTKGLDIKSVSSSFYEKLNKKSNPINSSENSYQKLIRMKKFSVLINNLFCLW